ncbi:MAG: ABC transporter ATP-binding protein [Candidatus Kryptonium sp.]|nr:ABC transporter ATP-binding protein [Candidatus Kryptonium sp.]MCX7762483.1 ABC transporter ATP-binding protein [Candidatus Kryptonium sp.]MDW8109557.1 ABC transporter ATP-binding protein [Candidatus Kryptonium sp.]
MIVKVSDICFSYKHKPVLKNISFEVAQGEFVSLIGPNGSGKTTLLKILIRLLLPNKGEVLIFNKNINSYSLKDLARIIGFVPQDNFFAFPYTVLEVVLMGRTPYLNGIGFETNEDIEIALEVMELTNIKNLADKPITSLSFGERQMVLIARALAQQPQIILLDEPNAHLDISHQIETFSLLKTLAMEKNVTVIAVSHDLNLIASYSDRVILLSNGEIYAMGKPDIVLSEDNIKNVYNADVLVDINPATAKPRITLLPDKIGQFIDKLKNQKERKR